MEIISDKELIKIPVKDNGERLVNLTDFCPGIILKDEPHYLRKSVAKRLCNAQRLLPTGYCLKIVSTYRTVCCQKKIYSDFYKSLKKQHSSWTKQKLTAQAELFAANPKYCPPHCTGAAVDLTVVGKNKKQLDMGTAGNYTGPKAYTNYKKLPKKVKNNRKILIMAMEKSGFANYPVEWWHWSYGDRIWAALKNKKHAVYGTIKIKK